MTTLNQYEPLPSLEDCDPGLSPGWKFDVLILQAVPQEKSKGGIILAASTKEDEALASTEALIVEISPMAFIHQDWPDDVKRAPYKAGDHVITKRYPAGVKVRGADGRDYMIVKDDEIVGLRTKAAGEPAKAQPFVPPMLTAASR